MTGKTYSLYGFTLRSELVLTAAAEVPSGADAPGAEMRFGRVPAREGERLWIEESGALVFEVPEVARFRVANGREIVVDPVPGVSERNLRVFLLGSAMGALLHQRGLVPLHANAIEIDGRAVAFSGKSGAGKSTLAAWFADRGHRILCDDVCAIAPGTGEGPPLVLPGVPRLRLWEDAVAASGRRPADYERSFDGQDKYDVPAGAAAGAAPLPLGACYMLALPGEEPARGAGIERLSGVAAIEALIANTYRGHFLRTMKRSAPHLSQCIALAAAVPVHRAGRRWGRDAFDAEAEALRDHARVIFKEQEFQPLK